MPTFNTPDSQLYAARITPEGRGGVAVILVAGEFWTMNANQETPPFISRVKVKNAQPEINRIIYGLFLSEEIVLCRTSESIHELHCHGGPQAVERILSVLKSWNFKIVDEFEIYQVAKLNSTFEIELNQNLSHVMTTTTADILLSQSFVLWKSWIEKLKGLFHSGNFHEITKEIEEALNRSNSGIHLSIPYTVAIAGLPNAGKSSLINAILGYERAIVYEQPGTTRDLVKATTAINGWPFTFVDTAGLRETNDPLETAGIDKARGLIGNVDLTILLIDLGKTDDEENRRLILEYPQSMLVGNKMDSVKMIPADIHLDCLISAKTGLNIDRLCDLVFKKLIPETLNSSLPIPFTVRQVSILKQCKRELENNGTQTGINILSRILDEV